MESDTDKKISNAPNGLCITYIPGDKTIFSIVFSFLRIKNNKHARPIKFFFYKAHCRGLAEKRVGFTSNQKPPFSLCMLKCEEHKNNRNTKSIKLF
jgi:hypothetical protein